MYLNSSTSSEQDRLFESLSLILDKMKIARMTSFDQDTENLSNLTSKFYKIVLPFVKQNFSKNGSIWLPELAANYSDEEEDESNNLPEESPPSPAHSSTNNDESDDFFVPEKKATKVKPVKTKSNRQLECSDCGKFLSNSFWLKKHKESFHPVTETEYYISKARDPDRNERQR